MNRRQGRSGAASWLEMGGQAGVGQIADRLLLGLEWAMLDVRFLRRQRNLGLSVRGHGVGLGDGVKGTAGWGPFTGAGANWCGGGGEGNGHHHHPPPNLTHSISSSP